MTEDKRAHERIGDLEERLLQHLDGHHKIEAAVQCIADNTKELVDIGRGLKVLKGFRDFAVWLSPIAVAVSVVVGAVVFVVGAILSWLKPH